MIDYDELAAAYARHRRLHPEVLKKLLSTGGLTPSSRVLEVGCGTANYLMALVRRVGCSGWGIDPSSQMLARAGQRLAGDEAAKITLKPGRADHLEFPPAFFDLFFSVDVVHHLAGPGPYFQEAHRVLKAGGKLCTVTDSEDIIRRRRPLALYFPETAAADLTRYPSITQLRQLMVRAGFQHLTERTVEFSYQLSDIQLYRDRSFSVLHLISAEALQRGLARMERDLGRGPIRAVVRYLLLWGVK